jgi:hypothetical protein
MQSTTALELLCKITKPLSIECGMTTIFANVPLFFFLSLSLSLTQCVSLYDSSTDNLQRVCPLSQVAKLIVSHIKKDHITYSTHVDQGKNQNHKQNAQKEDSLAYNGIGQTGRRSEDGNIIKKTKVLECAINGAARMCNQPTPFLCLCRTTTL